MTSNFKANPYNSLNVLIKNIDIHNIFKKFNLTIHINDINIYQRAFNHKSYCEEIDYSDFINDINALPLRSESYEKMEFLGDSILGFITCEYIYSRYIDIYKCDECFSTKMKNRLVCGENLAVLSKSIGLDRFIVISKHIDENCDGRNNQNILEDVFEAFIGAIYLDTGDIEITRSFLINIYERYIDFSDIITRDTNYKDILIRYMQNTFNVRPTYDIVKHEDRFECNVLKDIDIISSGKGISKKKSEQDASHNALIKYGVIN